ncbi:unnamed protein product [marine sediment metagenome]|uniref:Uncharacterized protein n=1 Tax=marine sediment metagenome TaxID=412755 RepID=X0ZJP8_9ZZZZ
MVGVIDEDNIFFTEKGYKDHVESNGHNLKNYCSFVKHAFRNPELVNLFANLGKMVGVEWDKK